MIEVKWYARGGQGGFTACRLLALACVYESNKYVQAFPSFGPERRGALVFGFTRIDDKPIQDHSQLDACDYAIVLDPTLMETIDVSKGIKENGILFINTPDSSIGKRFSHIRTVLFDASAVAMEILRGNITNSAMMAVCASVTRLAGVEAMCKAIREVMNHELAIKNETLVRTVYEMSKQLNINEVSTLQKPAFVRHKKLFPSLGDRPHISEDYRFPLSKNELPFGPAADSWIFIESNAGWRTTMPIVDKSKCIHCMQCWVYCPEGVINKNIEIDLNYCKGCGLCARQCPRQAITMIKENTENAG